MKIVQVCPRYLPYIGGVETHVRELSKRLARRGFEVVVLTTDSDGGLPKRETIDDVEVRRFGAWAPGDAYYFSRELKSYLLRNSDCFDVVHAHCYHAFPALYATQAKSGNRLVFTSHYHGTGHTFFRSMLHIPYRFVGRRIFDKADKVICVSGFEKGLIRERFEVDEGKFVVIPNGVNLTEFRNLQKRESHGRIILTVSRLEKYKGIQYLIRVLPLLDENVTLDVVGKGPYRESLMEIAQRLGVGKRIRFSHDLPREELLRKFADANVFALLSEHEAYGITVAEALCAGTPCIVTRTSALTEWIDGRNCFGLDLPINLNALAILIRSIIGLRASKPNVLDWDKVVDALIAVYEECMPK